MRGIIRLDDKSLWVSPFFILSSTALYCVLSLLSLFLSLSLSLSSSFIPTPLILSLSLSLSLSSSFLSALRIFSLSLSLCHSCSVSYSLLLLCLSLSRSLLISIGMPSFYSLSCHIFISVPTVLSILLLFFFLRMSANCACSTCLRGWCTVIVVGQTYHYIYSF